MKNKCKNILKLTLVCFLLILTACEAEKDYIVSENSNQNYQLKKISFSNFKSNQSAFQKLKEAHSKKKPNLKHKGIYNDDYGVFIDTTNIIVVENNGKQSITFQIIDETFSSKIENLVLNSKEDGGYTAYITEYLLSQQELQAIEKGEKIISKEPQTITKLENYARINITGNGAHCVDIITVTVKYCTGIDGKVIENTGDVGRNGCYGGFFEEDYQVLNISAGCLSNGNSLGNGNIGGYNPPTSGNNPIGGGASGGGGAVGGSPGSSNNPGTGTTNPQNPIVTTPILNLDKIEIKLLNSFSTDQLNWWNNVADKEIKEDILAYVKNYLNLEQEETSQFVKELINFSINNNIEINNNFILENLNNFSNFIELEQFINHEVNSDVVTDSNLFENDKIITTRKVSVTSLHELTLEIVITPNPNFSLDENNSTSFFSSDLLPGNSWTQTSIIVTNENFSQTSAEITISGYINIGVKVGDYVMGVKKRKQIKIRINKNNGNIWYSEVKNLN